MEVRRRDLPFLIKEQEQWSWVDGDGGPLPNLLHN